ncbi:hypothetical protein CBW18_21030 [Pedobacter sp. AJM]|nr:hypothetical protein CBW18_21030 [Pedobacter sp. AJM]
MHFRSLPHNPRQDQSGSGGISKDKSLDAAAIKISVGFYKKLRSNLLCLLKQHDQIKNGASLSIMPVCLLFLMAGMLSLRSGLLLLDQAKSKSPSAAVSRGKTEPRKKNSARFKVPACAGSDSYRMTNYVYEKFKDLSATVEMTTKCAPHSFRVINLRMPVSAPCYPAWQIFAGKSTKIFALPIITSQPKAGSKRER